MEVDRTSELFQMDTQLENQSAPVGEDAWKRAYGKNKLTQTPNNERFHALYMQHADGNTDFWKKPDNPNSLIKNGSIDSQEAFNVDYWVGGLLRGDSDNTELKKAKEFTELVNNNFDVISKLDGNSDSISEKDLELAFSAQPHLTGLKLGGQDLRRASLTNENLVLADLRITDLTRVNLTEVNLTGANLTGADLTGANLAGANLTGTNLTGADLTGATFDENTIFSDNFNPFQHGMVSKNGTNSTINQSGIYNGTSGSEKVFLDGDNLDITVNGNAGADYVTLSTENSRVNINTGDGNDFISAPISNGSTNINGKLNINRTNNQVVIDGGAGYDVLKTDFQIDPEAIVTKNEDGSYTMRSGNDTITVKNIEEAVDNEGNRIKI